MPLTPQEIADLRTSRALTDSALQFLFDAAQDFAAYEAGCIIGDDTARRVQRDGHRNEELVLLSAVQSLLTKMGIDPIDACQLAGQVRRVYIHARAKNRGELQP